MNEEQVLETPPPSEGGEGESAPEGERSEPTGPTLPELQQQLAAERESRLMLEENQHKLERMLHASEKALGELRQDADASSLEALEARKREVQEAIVEAHQRGDVREDLALREQLTDLNAEIREAKRPKVKPAPIGASEASTDVLQNPEYKKWLAENTWFGTDAAMTGAALALMQELNATGRGRNMSPGERFNHVGAETKRRFNMAARRQPSKVESTRTEGGYGAGETGAGYEDMPVEAKRACDNYARRFVGKADANGNIKYKTLGEYRAHYAEDYWDDSWGTKQLTRYS
jgi:hypothetical protein